MFFFSLLIFAVLFTATPAGHNKLGNVVSKMSKNAHLQGQFSNHSPRATTATRGLEKGFSDKLIMERTGHWDIRSLQRYQRPDVSTKIEISKALKLSIRTIRRRKGSRVLINNGRRSLSWWRSKKILLRWQQRDCERIKQQCCVPELLVCNIQRL